jgi:hypothetical protein
MTTDLGDSGEFWDFNENTNYITIRASDGLDYKVWNHGSESVKKEVANTLAQVRKDINTILVHIMKNPQLWTSKPIAFGVYHTFDIHIPCLYYLLDSIDKDTTETLNNKINSICFEMDTLFNYQEMTPNKHGILGLNKPKIIKTIKVENENGKMIDYEIAEKRSMFLTIRDQKGNWPIREYPKILDLVRHELTHTTCNDVRWKPDNHMPPYPTYHKMMRGWAKEAGLKLSN